MQIRSAPSNTQARRLHHVNLQTIVGGGEVYTRAMTRALVDAGASVTLHVHPGNRFWDSLADTSSPRRRGPIEIRPAADEAALPSFAGETVIVHTKLSEAKAKDIAARNRLVGFAHLPMHQREPEWLRHCTLVATVSQYCIDLLRRAGVERLYPEPLYGIADLARGERDAPVFRKSCYLWDQRKLRDRLFSLFHSVKPETFEKRPGLTLGVVSLIVPIKQFPLLFSHLAPILARHGVNLEIFGAGGYAQVRDLRKELHCMGGKARFWGYQENVAAIYPRIDYLLAGLPEKEALGLNVLEAQVSGTPVLAPKAPPFTETVLDGETGFLYRDPREDGAASFEELLVKLKSESRPDPLRVREHLERFAYPAFANRVKRLLESLAPS